MLDHLQGRLTEVATVHGHSSFDKMGVRFLGSHRGVTYAPAKPTKFCFQLYAEAGTKSLYLQQLALNDRGIYPKSSVGRYLTKYPKVNMPLK